MMNMECCHGSNNNAFETILCEQAVEFGKGRGVHRCGNRMNNRVALRNPKGLKELNN